MLNLLVAFKIFSNLPSVLPECGIAESVAERINCRVDIAEAVGNVPDYSRNEFLKT